jgi:hypothetical protein
MSVDSPKNIFRIRLAHGYCIDADGIQKNVICTPRQLSQKEKEAVLSALEISTADFYLNTKEEIEKIMDKRHSTPFCLD